jgi:hypothetical protein
MRIRSTLLVAATAAAILVPVFAVSGAQAGASPAATAVTQPGIAGPNGTVPLAWVQATTAGLQPDMAGPNGTHPVARVEKRNGVTPASASGCNLSVCINVVGSGLYVSDWSTTAYPSTSVCSFAAYWANGVVIATSNQVCGNQNTVFYSDWNNPGFFTNNTQVCNTWPQIAGRPCEIILG